MPPPRRVTPLAGWSVVAAFVLIGIALVSTMWSTRSTTSDASEAVRRGEALQIEQNVRADLVDLEGPPTPEDLHKFMRDYGGVGLRYVAMVEWRNRGRDLAEIVSEVGTPRGTLEDDVTAADGRPAIVDDRLRVQVRPIRRFKGGRNWKLVVEVEPIQAPALRDAAARTLLIGAIAAASLLGVAIVLVLREARRNAEERTREHERRLASLGEMSAVLAHEIKNPLASLKGNAQLLAQMLPAAERPDDDPLAKSRAKAKRVVDEAVRLEQLTNDLLQFVRTGAISRTPTDPAALVREAVSIVPGEVEIDTARAPATWSLDAGRIREVVVNLVDNAIAAGPPVRVAVYAEDRRLVIEVADRGPGVPDEDRDKIFEPFHTGKTQGTGLGLAITRRVIEQHGGTIAVHRPPEGGARFRAEIPET
ncbi:MAG: HAMP domain-containing histidine kinase [Deltaproteobacteria bacterium]|nr:HAMP domain-containing histidine kinase [Deltaproteobacteria bacterium]